MNPALAKAFGQTQQPGIWVPPGPKVQNDPNNKKWPHEWPLPRVTLPNGQLYDLTPEEARRVAENMPGLHQAIWDRTWAEHELRGQTIRGQQEYQASQAPPAPAPQPVAEADHWFYQYDHPMSYGAQQAGKAVAPAGKQALKKALFGG